MITAPHHLAAQAGNAVLRDGGNAIEAMVAAAATIAVVYPHMNSIGGDGFWLISEPGKEPVGIDACGRAVAMATHEFYRERGQSVISPRGPTVVNTVPGVVSGWQAALNLSHTAGGRLPLARLLADAIWYAKNGAPVTKSQSTFTERFIGELADQPGFARTFLDNGGSPPTGSVREYPALAATLERLAMHGLDDFYRGSIAVDIASELERLGSPLRLNDLHSHVAQIVKPLSTRVKAGTIFNLPPPTQGLASLMILGIFDRLECAEAETFDHIHGLVEATKQAFLVRNRFVCDPAFMTVDPTQFLTAQALDERRQAINLHRARPWPGPAISGDTVWMGAADKSGMMVSYIQSVYWEFGSGVVLEGTGMTCQNRGSSFVLDNQSHLSLAPGRKPFHTLNPAFARLNDGRNMVYGNMGGDGQPQSQAAVFSRYAMFGQDLQQAVTSPRWLLGKTWGQASISLKLESRIRPEIIDRLSKAGHDVEIVEEFSDQMGHAGAVVAHPNGVLSAAADPRSDGIVAAF